MSLNQSLVWYASYGSNLLNEDGFLCYIKGKKRRGATQKERGCRDKTPPRQSKSIDIPFQLYFAERSSKWHDGGVAFIGLTRDENESTIGRMYLLTEEQFKDVIKQENDNREIIVDFQEVKRKGSAVLRKSWYGNVVYLGDSGEYPIFTFTHYKDIVAQMINKPSPEYIQIIADGLKEARGLNEGEIVEYLSQKQGVKGNYNMPELKKLVSKV